MNLLVCRAGSVSSNITRELNSSRAFGSRYLAEALNEHFSDSRAQPWPMFRALCGVATLHSQSKRARALLAVLMAHALCLSENLQSQSIGHLSSFSDGAPSSFLSCCRETSGSGCSSAETAPASDLPNARVQTAVGSRTLWRRAATVHECQAAPLKMSKCSLEECETQC